MQAHAGGERAAVTQMLDVWRLQAVAQGMNQAAVDEVSEVILQGLTEANPSIAPVASEPEDTVELVDAEATPLAERTSRVQRSRDGPNG